MIKAYPLFISSLMVGFGGIDFGPNINFVSMADNETIVRITIKIPNTKKNVTKKSIYIS